jgi:hypothetical protein
LDSISQAACAGLWASASFASTLSGDAPCASAFSSTLSSFRLSSALFLQSTLALNLLDLTRGDETLDVLLGGLELLARLVLVVFVSDYVAVCNLVGVDVIVGITLDI